jgi:hypothetical protein
MNFELLWQIFETQSNIKFPANPSGRNRVLPYRQTDRHDEAISPFSQIFLNRPQKSKVIIDSVASSGTPLEANILHLIHLASA